MPASWARIATRCRDWCRDRAGQSTLAIRVAIADVRDDRPRAFRRLLDVLRQQAVLCGYRDPDPDHDYVGLCTTAGTRHHCTFMAFDQ